MIGSIRAMRGEAVEELVLRPEHQRGPQDGGAGNAARTAASPAALRRGVAARAACGSAPMAEICTSRATPAAAARRADPSGALGMDALEVARCAAPAGCRPG